MQATKRRKIVHVIFFNLMLYIAKGYHPLSFIENSWLMHLIFNQCGCVEFPFTHLVNEVLLDFVTKTQDKYVFIVLCILHSQLPLFLDVACWV
jgi:hypothetical protein